MATEQREKRPRGRPRNTNPKETEVLNVVVSSDAMRRVRAELERQGVGATIAGWVRDAIDEKLERGGAAEKPRPGTPEWDAHIASFKQDPLGKLIAQSRRRAP